MRVSLLCALLALSVGAQADDVQKEYRKRLDALRPSDVAGHQALAEYALAHRLYAEAETLAKRMLMVSPGHPKAVELLAKARAGAAQQKNREEVPGPDRVPTPGDKPDAPKPPPAERVPPPPGEPVPLPPGSDDEPNESEAEAAERAAAQKALDEEAKVLARQFKIKVFRAGVRQSSGGDFPELELQFVNAATPKYLTLVFHAYSERGKVFRGERTVFGPDPKVDHVIVAAYHQRWVAKHGKLVAGRVEICAGTTALRSVIVSADLNANKAPRDWWKVEAPEDRMGFYGPGQHPNESNTLRAVKR